MLEVLAVDYNELIALSGKSRKEIDLLFEKLGIVEDIVDLAPQKIYEILIALYEDNVEPAVTKQIYTKLNLKYKTETIDGLINSNPMYEKFRSEGGVLAELNGRYVYLPVKDVYYVDKKIYSEDILKKYPLLALGKRAGASKIQKMFCVQPIQATGEIQVEYKEHDLNVAYQKEFQRILPYIYGKRISVDSKNKEFNALRSAKIILVKEATSTYTIGEDRQRGVLQDYELIYKDKVAYIKVPMHINSIDELKNSVKFRGAVAEVITTILDVDGDKDAFLIILACKTTKEADEYFIENGDDDLSTVKLAKTKFFEQIDRKTEFWTAIENALGGVSVDQSAYTELMSCFDYDNLNCNFNCHCIIKLFKRLGINVEKYNQYAFEIIDLQPYYKQELLQIKRKYRQKYLIHVLNSSKEIKTKLDFEKVKQKYDELTLIAPNSVNVELEKIFENNVGFSISLLNGAEGNLDELIKKLKDESQESSFINTIQESALAQKSELNYHEIDALIAANTNSESKKVELSALENMACKSGGTQKKSGTYEPTTTKTKEENGFIAESKVYHTLLSRVGSNGSVAWVSGNGHRVHANECGNDGLGYDIRYSDELGMHYVEVKGSTSENVEFVLTKNELEFAQQHLEEYEIWYVRIVDKQPTMPMELGNLLLLGEDETFFKNSKFTVENSEFKIRATVSEKTEK